jgi:hypothetical protein
MSAVLEESPRISIAEAVDLGAEDGAFYARYFFPRAVRQETPKFHNDVWDLLSNNRYASIKIFRGGAKTTLARQYTSRRIAYGMAHTVLFISKSEEHAIESVIWLKEQVEYNELWASAFHLRKGDKWTGGDIEIVHSLENYTIRVKAIGILGSVRGVNVKDYRPDTIVVDDPCDEENTATPEGRQKMSDIFFGAVKESLAPASEDPNASLCLLQTPLAEGDLCDECEKSGEFATLRVGILTDHTNEAEAESTWPARWSKETILEEKRSAEKRNQLSLWLREKMCLIVGRETSDFREEWLQYWVVLPPDAIYVGAIDPAPIKSEKARMLGTKGDQQAIAVCAYWRGNKYVVEYAAARDQDPDMLIRELNRLNSKYRIRAWGVETVAYQATLKWYLEKEIRSGNLMGVRVVEVPAVKGKVERIRQSHTKRASDGKLFVHSTHIDYIHQYKNHPNVSLKDIIDAVSMCDYVVSPGMESGRGRTLDESSYEDLGDWRASP